MATSRAPRAFPWKKAANEDNTFKSADELKALYIDEAGLAPGDDVIAYCRIGERSAHTWFVLTHLLGFERVRNYDGSWTEYGNAVRVPIEKPVAVAAFSRRVVADHEEQAAEREDGPAVRLRRDRRVR